MSDPMTWALPLGRLFGINIQVHVLFPLVALALILRMATKPGMLPGAWIDMSWIMVLLFLTVLLHEFGHCIGARAVGGNHQILMWPLGGLLSPQVPQTPKATFIATVAGPTVNIIICLITLTALCISTDWRIRPSFAPPFRSEQGFAILYTWDGTAHLEDQLAVITLARLFSVSWIAFLLNIVLIGFPMDAGRLLQCVLWPKMGFARSMHVATFTGLVTAVLVGVVSLFVEELLLLCLAGMIYITCRNQLVELMSSSAAN